MDFDGKTEDQDAPDKFTLQEVHEELKKLKDVCPGKHGGKRKQKYGEELVIYNQKIYLVGAIVLKGHVASTQS